MFSSLRNSKNSACAILAAASFPIVSLPGEAQSVLAQPAGATNFQIPAVSARNALYGEYFSYRIQQIPPDRAQLELRIEATRKSLTHLALPMQTPARSATLEDPPLALWLKTLDLIEGTLGTIPFNQSGESLDALTKQVDRYMHLQKEFAAAPQTLLLLQQELDKLGALPQSRIFKPQLNELRNAWNALDRDFQQGSSRYVDNLSIFQDQLAHLKLDYQWYDDQKRLRAGLALVLSTGLLSAAGVLLACKRFGANGVQSLTSTLLGRGFWRLQASLRDRISFLQIVWNSPKLAQLLPRDCKSSVGNQNAGHLISTAAWVLRSQPVKNIMHRVFRDFMADPPRSLGEISEHCVERITRPLAQQILFGASAQEAHAARARFEGLVNPDGPPCPSTDADGQIHADAKVLAQQTHAVMRSALDLHLGFSALQFEAQRLPDHTSSLVERFGYDVADAVDRLNALNNNKPPGAGLVISRFNRHRLLGTPHSFNLKTDKELFAMYREAWPWASYVFQQLPYLRIVFARQQIIVFFDSNDPRHQLFKVPMCYLVANEHFTGTRAHGGYLVPRQGMQILLQDATIPLMDYTGPDSNRPAIHRMDTTQILEHCRQFGVVVNLTSGSNLSGTLVNGFPHDRKPLHEWESILKKSRPLAVDRWGHVHKSYITGEYTGHWDSRLEEPLAKLRDGHERCYRIASDFQAALTLFWLRYQSYKQGQIPRRYGADLGTAPEERWTKDPLDHGARSNNAGRFLMLDEILHWNDAGHRFKLPKDKFPVLAVGNTFSLAEPPSRDLYLDSYNLSLRFDGLSRILPVDRARRVERLRHIWDELKLYEGPIVRSMRLYHRTILGL